MIVVVDPDARFCEAVKVALNTSSVTVTPAADLKKLIGEQRNGIAAIVVGPNATAKTSLRIAELVQKTAPEIGVVLVAKTLSADLLQAALRSGVRDVLPASFAPPALVAAIDRAASVAAALRGRSGAEPAATGPRPGKIITVFSPKGGVGKSVVATNLAVLLAQSGRPTVAVDLDLQFGDLAILFQLFPARTIYDAANHNGEVDVQTLMDYCTPHQSGLSLLPAPLEPGLAENVDADRAQTILRTLRAGGQTVVVDTPPWFTDHVLAALDISDEMVLVATMDVPSIKNIKVALQTLEVLGYPRDRLRLVLNRADSKVGLTLADIERALGTSVDVSIPSSREVPLSVNRGLPIAASDPRSPITASLAKLATLVSSDTPATSAAGKQKARFGRRTR